MMIKTAAGYFDRSFHSQSIEIVMLATLTLEKTAAKHIITKTKKQNSDYMAQLLHSLRIQDPTSQLIARKLSRNIL